MDSVFDSLGYEICEEDVIDAVFNGYQDINTDTYLLKEHTSRTRPTAQSLFLAQNVVDEDIWSVPPSFTSDIEDDQVLESLQAEMGLEAGPLTQSDEIPETYATLTPDMDMTSALTLLHEFNYNGKRPNTSIFDNGITPAYRPRSTRSLSVAAPEARTMTLDEASSIVSKPLRDELVKTYFVHVHPLCPIVDEFDWFEFYDDIEDDELKKHPNLLLFQVMMFAASAHITDEQLTMTSYTSVYDAQKSHFEKITTLYRRRFTSDHMLLTQVSLLLTYWSPYDAELKVNSYWVERAFYHARAIKLWDSGRYSGAMCCRRRIVWWMCLIRDRLISFGLRRPHRLQEAESDWALIKETDFGIEVLHPRYVDVGYKRAMAKAFISLCKLTDIMRTIAVFQENNRFEREWSEGSISREAIMTELTEVSRFDKQLKDWKDEYKEFNKKVLENTALGQSLIFVYNIVVCDSVLATLYLPYIHCPSGSSQLMERFQKVALRRIKAASLAVALHVRHIESSARMEDIPSCLIAWIALPLTVLKVLADFEDDTSEGANIDRFGDFMAFLCALGVRFHAAKLVADIMTEATDTIVEKSKSLGLSKRTVKQSMSNFHFVQSLGVNESSRDVKEAETLNCVVKMIDLRISSNDSP